MTLTTFASVEQPRCRPPRPARPGTLVPARTPSRGCGSWRVRSGPSGAQPMIPCPWRGVPKDLYPTCVPTVHHVRCGGLRNRASPQALPWNERTLALQTWFSALWVPSCVQLVPPGRSAGVASPGSVEPDRGPVSFKTRPVVLHPVLKVVKHLTMGETPG